jgi:hypothetical protein
MVERGLNALGFFGALVLWAGPFLWLWFGVVSAGLALALLASGLAIMVGAVLRLHKRRHGDAPARRSHPSWT